VTAFSGRTKIGPPGMGDQKVMHGFNRCIVWIRESRRGQTMTEYALILAAVAVVVYIGYENMGTSITSLLNTTDVQL